jgi:hypothetical protein
VLSSGHKRGEKRWGSVGSEAVSFLMGKKNHSKNCEGMILLRLASVK